MPHPDSPASMSILEESTIITLAPMMAVFNNLVMFDQHVAAEQPRHRSSPISPPAGAWDEGKTALTFKLRQGVKWHDGKPFTAADVKCTWDLLIGQGDREAARQPAQILVPQSRQGGARRRLPRSPFS